MELNELLAAFDATAGNLDKLERVWQRAQELTPSDITFGSTAEYDDLCRSWRGLLRVLPAIDGFRVEQQLADLDELARARRPARGGCPTRPAASHTYRSAPHDHRAPRLGLVTPRHRATPH